MAILNTNWSIWKKTWSMEMGINDTAQAKNKHDFVGIRATSLGNIDRDLVEHNSRKSHKNLSPQEQKTKQKQHEH